MGVTVVEPEPNGAESRHYLPATNATALGVQWTAELMGCDPALLDDIDVIARHMLTACEIAEATIIDSRFHKFSPQGVSGVVIIAESHLAIHTWPERGYAAIDVFTCSGELQTDKAIRFLASRFGATRVDSERRYRGDPRRLEAFRQIPQRAQRHSELYHYDEAFVRAFIAEAVRGPVLFDALLAANKVVELGEQIYQFQLFTPAWCKKILEECERHGGWSEASPSDARLPWEHMPGLEAVYAMILEHHVRPVIEGLWPTWKLRKWDPPAVRRYEPPGVVDTALHHDVEAVSMIGYLNHDFMGGGIGFPRWNLKIGDSTSVAVGSVVVYPGGVAHQHLARPVTDGRQYTLANSFY